MKKIRIVLMLIILILIICNISFAESEMQIVPNKEAIEKGEEIAINIEIKNIKIAVFTIELYWDNSKLEYISGPENSNKLNNNIIYTWVSENGEDRNDTTIETFKFKAIEDGSATITAIGEFYNSNGEKIEIENANLEITIGKENNKTEDVQLINQQNLNISKDNTNLSVLRLNQEGITPEFNKNIKEYYFVTDKEIQNLEITAIPENPEATVTITGNKNLIMGENIINIKVESNDKTKNSVYKIYLTKTKNLDSANANLETLAVRDAILNPEFDANMTQYKIEISNDIKKIDILAIPQKENAKVDIVGNGEMNVGDNKIEINVLAEDGSTHKKYEIIVRRRNVEEENLNEAEMKVQAERLSSILEQSKNEDKNTINKNNSKTVIIVTIIGVCIIIGVIIIYKYKFKN